MTAASHQQPNRFPRVRIVAALVMLLCTIAVFPANRDYFSDMSSRNPRLAQGKTTTSGFNDTVVDLTGFQNASLLSVQNTNRWAIHQPAPWRNSLEGTVQDGPDHLPAQVEQVEAETKDTDLSEPDLEVAWLLSFPNSGTSYTLTNTEQVTQQFVATNYAQELQRFGAQPVHSSSPNGPFRKKNNTSNQMPKHYILTKTHCGGYCSVCSPSKFIVSTVDRFHRACRESHRVDTSKSSSKVTKLIDIYPVGVAHRAIHLIRHPLDNIVSRMHFDLKKKKHEGFAEIAKLPADRQRLLAWCRWIGMKHIKELRETTLLPVRVKQLLLAPSAPFCALDLFRYTQWHNRAIEMTNKLAMPVHYLYYGDYRTSYDSAVDGVLKFLKQERVSKPREFAGNKTYVDSLFTTTERQQAFKLLQKLATSDFWGLLGRYVSNATVQPNI